MCVLKDFKDFKTMSPPPPSSSISGIGSNIIGSSSHPHSNLPWSSSLTFLPPRRRHHRHLLLPNLTRLTGGDDLYDTSYAQNFNQENISNNSNNSSNEELSSKDSISIGSKENSNNKIMAYTTPQSTSVAYNSGLLKSNDNISSNSSRIRLAFRYYLDHFDPNSADNETTGPNEDLEEEDDDKVLYICWIRHDGTPCHFRELRPVTNNIVGCSKNNNNDGGGEETNSRQGPSLSNKRLRGSIATATVASEEAVVKETNEASSTETIDNNSSSSDNSSDKSSSSKNSNNNNNDVLLINENDMIENTFPGHAFVICRKITRSNTYNNNNDNALVSRIDDDVISDNGGDDNDDEKDNTTTAATAAATTRVIQDDGNGCTVFLRRRNWQRSGGGESSSGSDRSTTSSTSLSLEEHKEERKAAAAAAAAAARTDDEYVKKKEDIDDGNDEWDAYLVIGGYRPGSIMPPMNPNHDSSRKDDDTSSKSNDEKENIGRESEGETHDNNSDDDDDDDDDDDSDYDSDDDEELNVHIVIIKRSRRLSLPSNDSHDEKDDDERDDDANMSSSLRGAADEDNIMKDKKRDDVNDDDNDINDDNESDYTYEDEDETEFSGFLIPVVPNSSLTQPKKKQQHYMDDCQVSVCMAKLDPTPVDMTSKQYDHVVLGGWPCRIQPGCFNSNSDNIPSLRARFEEDITAACQSLPPIARQKLQQTTPIWINSSHKWGPKVAPIIGRDACFHPGEQWLSRNGDNPLKCGGVEFYNAQHYLSDYDLWGPGGLILHELCHAWHNLHIDNGYDNHDIQECYNMAMNDGLYDCVRVHGPQGPECKAYACTNAMEYFAELSVAFLGGIDDTREHNKWYPFNRSQLREHDPRAFDMLCRMWGVVVTDDDNGDNIDEEEEVEEVETYAERSGDDSKGEGSKER